jgi:hypothetical protein
MSCNICGKTHRDKPCPPDYVVTTTTEDPALCPPAPLCEDINGAHCVIYTGPNIECAGINNGDLVSDVIQILLQQLTNCCFPTTTTTSTTTTSTTTTTTTSTTTTTTTQCPNDYYLICCGSYIQGNTPVIIKPCSVPSQFRFATYQVYSDLTNGTGANSYTWIVCTLTDIQTIGWNYETSSYLPDWADFSLNNIGQSTFAQTLVSCATTGEDGICPPADLVPTTTTTSTTTIIPCNCYEIFTEEGNLVIYKDCNDNETGVRFQGTPSPNPPYVGIPSMRFCASEQPSVTPQPYLVRNFGACVLGSTCNPIPTTTTSTTTLDFCNCYIVYNPTDGPLSYNFVQCDKPDVIETQSLTPGEVEYRCSLASGFDPDPELEYSINGLCQNGCTPPASYCAEVSVVGNSTITWIGYDSIKNFRTLINETIFPCAWEDSIVKISGTGILTINQGTVACTGDSQCVIEEFKMIATGLTRIAFSLFTSSQPYTIYWGDGNSSTLAAGSQTGLFYNYTTPFTGEVIIKMNDLTSITQFEIATPGNITPTTTGNATFPSSFPLYVNGSELVKLDGLVRLVLSQNILVNDATTLQLARTLKTISILWADMSGTIANLPNASPILKDSNVAIFNFNTISGNLSTMPVSYNRITISGENTISGNINTIQTQVTAFSILGKNTLTGDLATIPNIATGGLLEFNVQGYNTLSGNIRSFNIPQMLLLSIVGEENLVGNGGNTVSGTIDAGGGDTRLWNVNMVLFQVLGKNTISGTLSTFQNCTKLTRLAIDGKTSGFIPTAGNTITGNLNTLPVGAPLNRLIINGNNTVTGVLSDLTNYSGLQTAIFVGQNTISGDLSDLPKSIYNFNIEGNNTVNAYTIQKEKASPMNRMGVVPTNIAVNRLTSGQLEQLVIDLDKLVDTVGSRTWNKFEGVTSPSITLYGQWATPSGPALAAYNSLVIKLAAQGGTIIINDVA